MQLVKLSVSKDARLPISEATTLLSDDARALLPKPRTGCDDVRLALTDRLRPFGRFMHHGDTCSVVRKSTKGKAGVLDIWIHVCRVSETDVSYGDTPVCQIVGDGQTQPFAVHVSATGYVYRDLVATIGTGPDLLAYGAAHYFESDIRDTCKKLLENGCVPLWPGILLALTPEAHAAAASARRVLAGLDAGNGHVSLLTLDTGPANRQALAAELAEGFTKSLESLTERAKLVGPTTEKIQAEYTAISAKLALAESVLGIEIDCLDAQVGVELALAAAYAA